MNNRTVDILRIFVNVDFEGLCETSEEYISKMIATMSPDSMDEYHESINSDLYQVLKNTMLCEFAHYLELQLTDEEVEFWVSLSETPLYQSMVKNQCTAMMKMFTNWLPKLKTMMEAKMRG